MQAVIIIFQLLNIVYCNKLRTNESYNLQKTYVQPPPTPKNDWVLKKISAAYYDLCELTPRTACHLRTEKKMRCVLSLPIQRFVDWLLYCYYYRW